MGLAASQGRFLSLTSRKNDLEFQGQQVNQARTNLANQSANLFQENDRSACSYSSRSSIRQIYKLYMINLMLMET